MEHYERSETVPDTIASKDLTPGSKVRYGPRSKPVTLGRRKVIEDYDERDRPHFHPGWWIEGEEGRRGLADFVIDDPESPWEPVR